MQNFSTKINYLTKFTFLTTQDKKTYSTLSENSKNNDLYQVISKDLKYKNKLKIGKITNKSHPAYNQFGLFTLNKLNKEEFIIDYIGVVSSKPSETSDYCLNFEQGLNIDAEFSGNEARYINDFRGIEKKPNSYFKTYIDKSENNRVKIGVFTLSEIEKGSEILVSYGKSYWKSRGNGEQIDCTLA
ncbi:hypothetical protein HK099_006345 [Clydaea vesicula]|uniref:SET domain-containing protein n=1 Tax=Clydaea vesicula TaxID=447962 RepID=A0AAD5Y329_9FUNG|nr:hypothetical protein HK099_006345 [Clydaea vesicula]KAJ3384207.1 hypothetical protein HDU92_003732 [Lobulomyces angularis]